jgi:hypothetical protein
LPEVQVPPGRQAWGRDNLDSDFAGMRGNKNSCKPSLSAEVTFSNCIPMQSSPDTRRTRAAQDRGGPDGT